MTKSAVLVIGSCLLSLTAFAQSPAALNLLNSLDPSIAGLSGRWSMSDSSLKVEPDKVARLIVSKEVSEEFDVLIEFTRTGGRDSIALILPVGTSSVALELSAWGGEVHGLSRVDAKSAKDPENPSSIRPGSLENNRKQKLDVSVRKEAGGVSIRSHLNGQPFIEWKGSQSSLQPNLVLNLPEARSLGLAVCNSSVVFHRLELKRVKEDTHPLPVAESLPFEPFNGADFESVVLDGRSAMVARAERGSGDRGAYLSGGEFSEGTIEVSLRGSSKPGGSFVGVVFHGVDGINYEAVYFRPFNFGHADPVRRGHAVQYICHPEWPWQKLRESRPEEYENPVNPEPQPDEWFDAKIEVKGKHIQVFVNDSKTPCLEVDSLSGNSKGKVGLWFNGVASFAEFKITPSE